MLSRRKLIKNLAGLPLLSLLPSCQSMADKTLTTSDHFDGERFFNPWGSNENKSVWEVLRWRMTADSCAWRESYSSGRDYPPERVDGEQMRLSFIGHATVLLQTAGLNILFDPHWSERASPLSFVGPKRVSAPGVALADLPPIDWVLISHNHYDHLDLATIGQLSAIQPQIRYLTPLNNAYLIHADYPDLPVLELDWRQSTQLSEQVELIVQPAQHWSARGLFDRRKSLWAAFVLRTPGGNVYFAGDTGFGPHFQQTAELFAPFRLSMLPVGAYEPRWFMRYQHMNPAEAVQSAQILRSRHNLGVHLRTFADLTDECYDHPERDLNAALQRLQPEDVQFKLLDAGGSWQVPA